MAHEIMEHDNMISVHEVPWHGLGVVLPDYPTVWQAQEMSGLTWKARKEPVFFRSQPVDGMTRLNNVPAQYAIVRDDIDYALGIVGAQYTPFQNDDMFAFMERFMNSAGSKLETCGSLRNGRTVWALAQAGNIEYVKGDPVNKFFLFKNGFDGNSHIEICFTDIRVVCNNTLTAALKDAQNSWRIRHTSNLHDQMVAVEAAIHAQQTHAARMAEMMGLLTAVKVNENDLKQLTANIVLSAPVDAEDLEPGEDVMDTLTSFQKRTVDKILELHESGAGADIPGVRGTAYGLLQAHTEFADHFRVVRPGERPVSEARFESIMMGGAHQFKTRAFYAIRDYALAA